MRGKAVLGWPLRAGQTDAAIAAVLFALAFGVRATLLHAAPYGDEAGHFTEARSLGGDLHVFWLGPDISFRLYPLVLARPLFALLHAPGAWTGFFGFRALGIAYAALLPSLVFLLARQLAVRRSLAVGAGTAAALLPSLVVWGARIFPDSLMAVLLLAALLAWAREARRLAAVLLVAAAWTKETAILPCVLVAGTGLWEAWRGRRRLGASWGQALRPVGIDRWLLGSILLAPVPLLVAWIVVPRLPGWSFGGTLGPLLEQMPLSSLLLVPLVWALRWREGRLVAGPTLAVLAFYAGFVLVRGGQLQGWYAILPASLTLVACGVCAERLLVGGPRARMAGRVTVVGVALVLAGLVVGLGAPLVHPVQALPEPGLVASASFVAQEGGEETAAQHFQQAARPGSVLEVDVPWFFIDYPFAGSHATTFVQAASMPTAAVPVLRIAQAVEGSDLTWVHDQGTPLHQAIHLVYGDCLVFTSGPWEAFGGRSCPGRSARLAEESARLSSRPG